MKTVVSLALLCLIGCASKPKPPLPVISEGSYCGQRYLDADCPSGWYVDSDHKRWPKSLLATANEHTLRIFHESQFCRLVTTHDLLVIAELSTRCHNVHQEATWLPDETFPPSGDVK